MMARITFALALFAGLCQALVGAPVPSPENPNVDIIYQFPPTMAPENEFLRSNGQLLTTCLTCNILSQLDPNLGPTQKRRTVYAFPNADVNVLGIDQLFEDIFVVAVGQVDLSNPLQLNSSNIESRIQGPTGVYVVDLRRYQAPTYDSSKVRAYKVGGVNTGGLFDGVAVINAKKGLVAVTDFAEGNIWLVDMFKNTTTILVEQPVLPPSNGQASSLILANGMKYKDSKLFFSASQDGTYGYVPVDPNTGKKTGPVKVIYNYGFSIDDFNFGPTGNTYFTTFADPNGGVLKRAAGTPSGQNGTTMPVSYFATNSIIPRNVKGGKCELIMTVFLQFQIVRALIPGPC